VHTESNGGKATQACDSFFRRTTPTPITLKYRELTLYSLPGCRYKLFSPQIGNTFSSDRSIGSLSRCTASWVTVQQHRQNDSVTRPRSDARKSVCRSISRWAPVPCFSQHSSWESRRNDSPFFFFFSLFFLLSDRPTLVFNTPFPVISVGIRVIKFTDVLDSNQHNVLRPSIDCLLSNMRSLANSLHCFVLDIGGAAVSSLTCRLTMGTHVRGSLASLGLELNTYQP